ncbi:hypothetical protein FLONG3_7829 [Fusarium longipes]|uniref:Uncharacterized protein n=1 Tax=Fusarium longipes TaxID=694270 RepID=A0A395S9V8_9HYPO|nr:hypothetical protein FLONG3_7829 [Fusarium longipes]
MSFDILPRRFSISIDGQPIAMPTSVPDRTQAQPVGPGGFQPAVFEVWNEHLVAGPFVMGRVFAEDRSLMPKRVVWCERDDVNQVQPVQVQMGEDGPQIKLSGGGMAFHEGRLVSPLLPGQLNQIVKIVPVP